MSTIIEIRNISKQYRLGESAPMYGSLREALLEALRKPWKALRRSSNGRAVQAANDFWALKDVNIEVQQGETLAIIGQNGAGKSTLLKIISRVVDPTEGLIRLRGRMASLLEVGTGFHRVLTGRENIYLLGAVLGMRKAEIDAKFDEIVAFAGIGQFLDTPVKRYSSGMYVRLAFAVAANLDPEILIVDEVLAVGDVAFQKKCLGKMSEVSQGGRTVLFVSHNLAAVEALCRRGVVLDRGRVVFSGTATDAVRYYLHNVVASDSDFETHAIDLGRAPGRPAKCHPLLNRLELFAEDGSPFLGDVQVGRGLKARIYFELDQPCVNFDAWLGFETLLGQRVCTAHTAYEPDRAHEERSGSQSFVCDIGSLPLVPGEYKLSVGLDIAGHEIDWVENATQITITGSDYYGTGVVPTRGAFLLDNRWRLSDPSQELVSDQAALGLEQPGPSMFHAAGQVTRS